MVKSDFVIICLGLLLIIIITLMIGNSDVVEGFDTITDSKLVLADMRKTCANVKEALPPILKTMANNVEPTSDIKQNGEIYKKLYDYVNKIKTEIIPAEITSLKQLYNFSIIIDDLTNYCNNNNNIKKYGHESFQVNVLGRKKKYIVIHYGSVYKRFTNEITKIQNIVKKYINLPLNNLIKKYKNDSCVITNCNNVSINLQYLKELKNVINKLEGKINNDDITKNDIFGLLATQGYLTNIDNNTIVQADLDAIKNTWNSNLIKQQCDKLLVEYKPSMRLVDIYSKSNDQIGINPQFEKDFSDYFIPLIKFCQKLTNIYDSDSDYPVKTLLDKIKILINIV